MSFRMLFKNRLAANALANIVQMLGSSLLLFALYRYINKELGVGQLGVWSAVIATVSASRLANFGLTDGVTRFVASYLGKDDRTRAALVVDVGTISAALLFGVLLPVIYLASVKVFPWFFHGDPLMQARSILPPALISLWLTIVGGVSLGGLDGIQRMDLRALIMLSGQVLRLLLSIWLVPVSGIVGLAYAQIGQSVFLMAAGRCLLCVAMPNLSWLPWRWKWSIFIEMLGYGANMQASTFFMLLFDPVTKALIAHFGGVASVGYFEMANQVVVKARSVIVAANQVIVPHVASWSLCASQLVLRIYRENMRALIFVTLLVMSLVMASGPILSQIFGLRHQPEFLFDLLLLTAAWSVNIFGSPAYFINMGTAHVGTNTIAHAVAGIVSAITGAILGWCLGVSGVLFGYVAGLIAGTLWLLGAFSLRYRCGTGVVNVKEHAWLAAGAVVVMVSAVLILVFPSLQRLVVAAAYLSASVLLLCGIAWFHGLRQEYWLRLFGRKPRGA